MNTTKTTRNLKVHSRFGCNSVGGNVPPPPQLDTASASQCAIRRKRATHALLSLKISQTGCVGTTVWPGPLAFLAPHLGETEITGFTPNYTQNAKEPFFLTASRALYMLHDNGMNRCTPIDDSGVSQSERKPNRPNMGTDGD